MSSPSIGSGNIYTDVPEGEDIETHVQVAIPQLLMAIIRIREREMFLYNRIAPRKDGVTGRAFTRIFLTNSTTCYEMLRMEPDVFKRLCAFLREVGGITNSRSISIEEKLAMFLHIIGHGVRHRVIGHIFQHSTETVSRAFHEIGDAFLRAANFFIHRRPLPDGEQPEIKNNTMWYPYFKGCIGAIDGTHISAFVPKDCVTAFRDRKGNLSWNLVAACSHDMIFTHIIPGWEGSAHDAHILDAAPNKEDLMPYADQYYVVDAGFSNLPGFLAPYKGERYHRSDFHGNNSPTNRNELFNKLHASVRNVIERSFGVLKKRWAVLRDMPNFKLQTQLKIITACVSIHNFIRRVSTSDILFDESENDVVEDEGRPAQPPAYQGRSTAMEGRRDEIRNFIWRRRSRHGCS